VIWMMAARDLFMSRGEAAKQGVHWSMTKFRDADAPAPAVAAALTTTTGVTAKVLEISKFPASAKTTPYPHAVISVRYRIEAGDRAGEEIVVMHWVYRNREPQPAARLQPGDVRELQLQSWAEGLPAYRATLLDDFAELDCFYSELRPQ
jgi:hypothetical protein